MTPLGDFLTTMFLTMGIFSFLITLLVGLSTLGGFISDKWRNFKWKKRQN
jgi:hypothetical protein